jgi:hypothetical protein
LNLCAQAGTGNAGGTPMPIDGRFDAPEASSLEKLAADGVVEIRRFLSEARSVDLRSTVNDIYDAMNVDTDMGSRKLSHNFQQWNGVWLEALPSYLSARNPKLAATLSILLDDIGSETRRTFGSKWEFFPERSFFRRHLGRTALVPWHIDADAAAVAHLAGECINVWMPLDHVGTSLPSLDIVVGSGKVMRKIPKLTGDSRYRDDAFVSSIGGHTSAPILNVGDALVFDQYTLHRTQHVDGSDIVRTACEFRFVQNRTWISTARKFLTRLSA